VNEGKRREVIAASRLLSRRCTSLASGPAAAQTTTWRSPGGLPVPFFVSPTEGP
jgi:hypothetical protein